MNYKNSHIKKKKNPLAISRITRYHAYMSMQPSPETNKRDEDGFGADSKVCVAGKETPESLWGRATVGGKVGHGKVCVCGGGAAQSHSNNQSF